MRLNFVRFYIKLMESGNGFEGLEPYAHCVSFAGFASFA
jgi:hypothetical protein